MFIGIPMTFKVPYLLQSSIRWRGLSRVFQWYLFPWQKNKMHSERQIKKWICSQRTLVVKRYCRVIQILPISCRVIPRGQYLWSNPSSGSLYRLWYLTTRTSQLKPIYTQRHLGKIFSTRALFERYAFSCTVVDCWLNRWLKYSTTTEWILFSQRLGSN